MGAGRQPLTRAAAWGPLLDFNLCRNLVCNCEMTDFPWSPEEGLAFARARAQIVLRPAEWCVPPRSGEDEMKALVAVKRVIDYNVKVRVKADKTGVETANVKMSMNPFDEIAVEEALRLREAGIVSEIIAVSLGAAQCQETIRTALAMGADRGILVQTDAELQPLAVAKLLKAVILAGKAGDRHHRQAGHRRRLQPDGPDAVGTARLAAGDLRLEAQDQRRPRRGHARGRWRARDGLIKLPAVVTTDLRLNEPRYASLPNIMRAKKKPIATTNPEALGVDVAPRLVVLKVEEPPSARAATRSARSPSSSTS